ncbi:MAG: DUF5675 family protein [Endomicrobium sp.]|nr:DUF5675 family protein [Endomicrobium sp.]
MEKDPFLCNTLERKGAIAKGKYTIIINSSYKFNKELPLLLDLPNRMAIRIHKGNTAKDTQGCILVGINDKAGWVSKSAKYGEKVVALIGQYKTCWITIV